MTTIGRYLVFAGNRYYPAGGWEDCYASCKYLEAAKIVATHLMLTLDWAHVVNLDTDKIIFKCGNMCAPSGSKIHTVTFNDDGSMVEDIVTL